MIFFKLMFSELNLVALEVRFLFSSKNLLLVSSRILISSLNKFNFFCSKSSFELALALEFVKELF